MVLIKNNSSYSYMTQVRIELESPMENPSLLPLGHKWGKFFLLFFFFFFFWLVIQIQRGTTL
ncbi:hypothetical protein HanIR_Chr05g0209611 [Helianthus annuus]|nr:hypothetical protein HanIR_Chr05g0209611 [Helianthus annuus]